MTKNDCSYNQPRLPNPDTLSYLRSLPLNEQRSRDEIQLYLKTKQEKHNGKLQSNDEVIDIEYPQTLYVALSAIDEIQNEIASLAADEYGSQFIEVICRISAPYSLIAARKLLRGICKYIVHLATHRYGSHSVQTILELSISDSLFEKYDEFSNQEVIRILEIREEESAKSQGIDVDQTLPSIQDLIVMTLDYLLPFVPHLAVHICGSHVLRSFLCLLTGVHMSHVRRFGNILDVGSKFLESGSICRRKKKKKEDKITINPFTNDSGNSFCLHGNMFMSKLNYTTHSRIDIKSERLQIILHSFITSLLGTNKTTNTLTKDKKRTYQCCTNVLMPGKLQQLACHPSASPLIFLLIRVMTYYTYHTHSTSGNNISPNIVPKTFHELEMYNYRLGILPVEPMFPPFSPAEHIVHQILCWNPIITESKMTTNASMKQPYANELIYAYAGHPCGSHILECVLRYSHNDLFYEIVKSTGLLNNIEIINDYIQHPVSNFVIQTLLCSIRTSSQAEQINSSLQPLICNGYLLYSENKRRGILWRLVEILAKFKLEVEQKIILKNMCIGFSVLEQSIQNTTLTSSEPQNLAEKIHKLISCTISQTKGKQIKLDSIGVRIIYHLLRFYPRLCIDTLSGVLKLSPMELEYIANDGLGSRCILDGILDGPSHQEPFQRAIEYLLQKLQGHWLVLANQRIGHHVVKKIFTSLKSVEQKSFLCSELAKGIHRLSGNSMGRSIVDECSLMLYIRDKRKWLYTVRKNVDKKRLLKKSKLIR